MDKTRTLKKRVLEAFSCWEQASESEQYWKMKLGEICLSSVEAESLKENVWRWVDKRMEEMDGLALSLQIVGCNQLLYGAGAASWSQGAWARLLKSTKATKEPRR